MIRIIIMMPMIIMITKIIMTMMIYTVFPFSKVAILSHLKTSRVMEVNIRERPICAVFIVQTGIAQMRGGWVLVFQLLECPIPHLSLSQKIPMGIYRERKELPEIHWCQNDQIF